MESNPDAADLDEVDLDIEKVIVACGSLVGDVAIEDGENEAEVLEIFASFASGTEELATSLFENVEITGVIDVVSNSAFCVTHPMFVNKDLGHDGSRLKGWKGRAS